MKNSEYWNEEKYMKEIEKYEIKIVYVDEGKPTLVFVRKGDENMYKKIDELLDKAEALNEFAYNCRMNDIINQEEFEKYMKIVKEYIDQAEELRKKENEQNEN